jgi:hypothetical protein
MFLVWDDLVVGVNFFSLDLVTGLTNLCLKKVKGTPFSRIIYQTLVLQWAIL